MAPVTFNPGESARVRHSIHCPYSGQVGTVLDFDPSDNRGAYLVLFSDGLKFRYKSQELESPDGPPHSGVFKTLYRAISETRHGIFPGSHPR